MQVEYYDLPLEIRGELRPYQRAGIAWLAFLRRCGLHGCLADDMGLGKTLQATAIVAGGAARRPLLWQRPRRAACSACMARKGGLSLHPSWLSRNLLLRQFALVGSQAPYSLRHVACQDGKLCFSPSVSPGRSLPCGGASAGPAAQGVAHCVPPHASRALAARDRQVRGARASVRAAGVGPQPLHCLVAHPCLVV